MRYMFFVFHAMNPYTSATSKAPTRGQLQSKSYATVVSAATSPSAHTYSGGPSSRIPPRTSRRKGQSTPFNGGVRRWEFREELGHVKPKTIDHLMDITNCWADGEDAVNRTRSDDEDEFGH